MTIHLDVTQLLRDPRRTGIQRAERELIRHWPGPRPLVPCRFDDVTGQLHELPRTLLERLCEPGHPDGVEAEIARLRPLLRPQGLARPDRILSAELFFDPARAAFYGRQDPACRTYWLVYDFLPWLHPDWFSTGSPARLMPYIHALDHVSARAYISAATKRDYQERIARRPCDGPVIPMGADGLGLERQSFDPASRRFVMLGTIEPRKNAAPVMQAFRQLWQQGVDAELTLIGTTSPDAPVELALLDSLAAEPRFRHLGHIDDDGVRAVLRGARAMLFPSEGEGYGIPPTEALHAGIPVVIADTLPALANAPGLGQLRLGTVTPETIADAVRTLLDDTAARALWQAAATMTLPTWSGFSHAVASWVHGPPG